METYTVNTASETCFQNHGLIVALDLPDTASAVAAAKKFSGLDIWLKVGLELFTAEGPSSVKALTNLGFSVFLDMKFHDIPNTVAGAVNSAVKTGASLISLHISGGKAMMEAAISARDQVVKELHLQNKPRLLGITVLTSTAQNTGQKDLVLARALEAKECGLDGIVCSGQEVESVKKACGNDFLCVCPGIRLADGMAHDQARVCTPRQALQNGANFLVVGRPIMNAVHPEEITKEILAECMNFFIK